MINFPNFEIFCGGLSVLFLLALLAVGCQGVKLAVVYDPVIRKRVQLRKHMKGRGAASTCQRDPIVAVCPKLQGSRLEDEIFRVFKTS